MSKVRSYRPGLDMSYWEQRAKYRQVLLQRILQHPQLLPQIRTYLRCFNTLLIGCVLIGFSLLALMIKYLLVNFYHANGYLLKVY